ncbi:MAG: sigma-54-dependent Fis family transcriptional regulator [Deferrisomatales bacterium]
MPTGVPQPLLDPEQFLKSTVNYLDVLRVLDEGVVITDATGRIMFMNDAHVKIDGVDPARALGSRPEDIWDVTDETSVILACLRTAEPVVNRHLVYKTYLGRTANTISSAFPLFDHAGLVGAVAFVREYNLMEETITSICARGLSTGRRPKGNGTRFSFGDIIGDDPSFLEAVKTAKMAALTPSPIMIHGETGTGKELFAQSIHNFGPRKERPYVAINCAAIPENLLEGILFGTVKGAFTGAVDRPGLFEKATGGTLFLDEVNSMPVGLQAKLLRVIQEKRVRRVGSLDEREVDVKVVSSVNEPPHRAVDAGRLRLDLFYRLGVVLLHVPPLRDRRGDIPVLTRFFLERCSAELGRKAAGISEEVRRLFLTYPWPGNVRELEHVIEGAINILGERREIAVADLPPHVFPATPPSPLPSPQAPEAALPAPRWTPVPAGPPPAPADPPPLADLPAFQAAQERRALEQALAATRGNLSRAGKLLGMSRQRLTYRLKKHGLDRRAYMD